MRLQPARYSRRWDRPRRQIESWVFGVPPDAKRIGPVRRSLQFAYALLRDLLGGQLNLHAMGLVYATLLAIVPLLALSFAILRFFGVHRELEPLILEFFRPMGDAAAPLTQQVMSFAENVRAGLVGAVGLALLLWTLFGALKKVEDSLNFVWHVTQARSFGRRVAEYLGLLVIGPLLLGPIIGASQLMLGESSRIGLHQVAVAIAPLLIMTTLFTMIYRVAPNTPVRWRAALCGAVAAGVLWAIVGRLFTAFVLLSTRWTMVYAGLAIVMASLVWTYLSWVILLLGAQLSFYTQNPAYLRIGMIEPQLSGSEQEQLTLSILYLAARRQRHNEPHWTVDALASELQLPGVLVARSVAALEGAGLLASTEDGWLSPTCALAETRVADALAAARHSLSESGKVSWSPPAAVSTLCDELDTVWRAQCGERTLGELLNS